MNKSLVKRMTNRILMVVLIVFGVTIQSYADVTCKATYGSEGQVYKLATGSPGELGLLKEIAEEFNKKNNTTMCWVKAGSGKSLSLLKDKKVDLIMVHAPANEKKAIKDGWAIKRTLIGSNEFYIVGPKNDPAGINKAKTVAEAYSKIAETKSNFLSRGDNSGTNKKELAIWKKAKIEPKGDWYIITKAFMMATLKQADEVQGYFMTDSSTWVAGKKNMSNLKVLFRGDPMLINHYHALAQPKGATASSDIASKFIDFLASDEGQKVIADYGVDKHGLPMYNDAKNSQ
jgi:tungstate transport system substrate-binding protein